MTQSFQGADQGTNQGESHGASFGAGGSGDNQNQGNEGAAQLTAEQIQALITRDEHAQNHIQTLEAETQQMREELESLRSKVDKSSTANELLEKLSNQQAQGQEIDLEDLVNKATQNVTKTLEQQNLQKEQDANFNKVAESVQSKYGENADVEMAKVATENGMAFEQLVELAHTNPTLVMKLCGLSDKAPVPPSQGSASTQQYQQDQQQPTVNIAEVRTDRERVDIYTARLDAKLKELGL
jgi:predicted RNase H-like nuclease (RuvC/YqgF family)